MTDVRQPADIVTGFIAAMNQWELDSWTARRAARDTATPMSYEAPARRALEAIYESFCTTRLRKYGRVENITFQRPPEYDPAKERVTNVVLDRTDRVFVDTERITTLGGGSYRYVVFLKSGQWRIDNLKCGGDEGWKPWIL